MAGFDPILSDKAFEINNYTEYHGMSYGGGGDLGAFTIPNL